MRISIWVNGLAALVLVAVAGACSQESSTTTPADPVPTEEAATSVEAETLADYLFTNARVYTVNASEPWAENGCCQRQQHCLCGRWRRGRRVRGPVH